MRGKESLAAVLFATVMMIGMAPPASAGGYEAIVEGGALTGYQANVPPDGFGVVEIFDAVEPIIIGPLPPAGAPLTALVTPYACIYFSSPTAAPGAALGCGPVSPDSYVADPLLMTAEVKNLCVPADIAGSGTLCTTATLTGTGPYIPFRFLDTGIPPSLPYLVFVQGFAFLERVTSAPSGTITYNTAGGAMSDGYGLLAEGADAVIVVIAP